MADDPKNPSATDDPKDPAPKNTDDPDLGEAGKRALEAERKARKSAEKSAKDLADRLKALEDKDKSDSEKATEARTTAENDAKAARAEAARLKVALRKGLTETQAKRLVGETEEEMESDADELLDSFKPSDDKGKPGAKPQEDLKGGGDPTEDPLEMNPKKLADMVERY